MKANELMIGDWVLLYGEPTKVTATLLNMMVIDEDSNAVQPIPLTAEILTVNGFFGSIEEEGKFYFPLYDDINQLGYALETNDGEAFFITGHELMVFDYVHELQQVLSLCGMDELADNFKIE